PKTNVIGGNALANKGTILNLPTGTPPPPPLHACAWVIADLNTGDIIAAHDPHSRFLPASTLKTLTALTVIDKLDPNQEIEGSGEDMAVDGTKVGIEKNATYPISALLQALMLSSANDAANALARANGGMDITTEQMNKLAAHLGAKDTHAMNTSGLDAKGQVTSAYDLALIGRAAVSHPKLAPLLTLKGAHFPAGAPKPGQQRKSIEIGSHNRLLWNYQGTIGVKNGYTVAARHTYIGAARRGDKAYVISYLSSFDGHWRSSAAMLDWAFNHGSKARPIGRLVNPGELDAPPPNKEKPSPPKGKPTTPKGGSNKPDNAKDTPITSAQDASPVAATSFHGHTSLPTNLALALSGLATLAATGALILHRRH
ncbi:D-alanyl-D-alanine carboxypeptidase, partial [Dermatophilus congolensis]